MHDAPAEKTDQETILELLNGGEPKNDMVAYFVDRLKALVKEGTELDASIAKGRKQLAMMQRRSDIVRNQAESYKRDLLEWNNRE